MTEKSQALSKDDEKSASAATAEPVLVARGICKSFPGVAALDHVDFEVRSGEVNALVGETELGNRPSSRSWLDSTRPIGVRFAWMGST